MQQPSPFEDQLNPYPSVVGDDNNFKQQSSSSPSDAFDNQGPNRCGCSFLVLSDNDFEDQPTNLASRTMIVGDHNSFEEEPSPSPPSADVFNDQPNPASRASIGNDNKFEEHQPSPSPSDTFDDQPNRSHSYNDFEDKGNPSSILDCNSFEERPRKKNRMITFLFLGGLALIGSGTFTGVFARIGRQSSAGANNSQDDSTDGVSSPSFSPSMPTLGITSLTPSTSPASVTSGKGKKSGSNPTSKGKGKKTPNPTFSPAPTTLKKASKGKKLNPSKGSTKSPSKGKNDGGSKGGKGKGREKVPSAMPSQPPSMSPSISMIPSVMPSQSPSMSPSISMIPSAMPSQIPSTLPTIEHDPLDSAFPCLAPKLLNQTYILFSEPTESQSRRCFKIELFENGTFSEGFPGSNGTCDDSVTFNTTYSVFDSVQGRERIIFKPYTTSEGRSHFQHQIRKRYFSRFDPIKEELDDGMQVDDRRLTSRRLNEDENSDSQVRLRIKIFNANQSIIRARLVFRECEEAYERPSALPSMSPSISMIPSTLPSQTPSMSPSISMIPSTQPSPAPSISPSISMIPSTLPSQTPSMSPSISMIPSALPSQQPSMSPSISMIPSTKPSPAPSMSPSISMIPSTQPSPAPSDLPSVVPSQTPSMSPSISMIPSTQPSPAPSISPSISMIPSTLPSQIPSISPSISMIPSTQPSPAPSISPSISMIPSTLPSQTPSMSPSISMIPSTLPSYSTAPSSQPSADPCDDDRDMFRMFMTTDNNNQETSFMVLIRQSDGSFSTDSDKRVLRKRYRNPAVNFETNKCIPTRHCYKVVVYDTAGDGLCCEHGQGSFQAYFKGVPIAFLDPVFDDGFESDSELFGKCD